MKKFFLSIISLLALVIAAVFLIDSSETKIVNQSPVVLVESDDEVVIDQDVRQTEDEDHVKVKDSVLAEPVIEFQARITKKPFGIYITPDNSPVSPEKFSGYHSGVDVEFADVEDDVEVNAIYEGKVIYSGFVNGYGGLMAVRHNFDTEQIVSLYGHLDSARLISVASDVAKGGRVGFLGKAYSEQTDGERKHLHFAIIKGKNINFRGYVASESSLSLWYDPLLFFKKYNENKLK